MTDQHQHDPEDRGYTEVISPAALDAMAGREVPLRDGPGGPVIGTARLAAGGVVEMSWDPGPAAASVSFEPLDVDRDVMRSVARDYADRIDRLLAEQVAEQVDVQLEAAGYAVPRHLDVRKMTGLLPVSTELLQPDRVAVPWRPSRRQRLAWWWQGVRERAGEWVAGRRFDDSYESGDW